MTFHSHTSEDLKSPITSDASIEGIESPQLVAQSLEGLGESYVVIAGSKPLSIIIKKCILTNSISDFNSFSPSSGQCSDNGSNQISVQEDKYSHHCVEIACVSSEETSAPCFKSAELHLDSISRSINDCGAIADGSAICEIDCGLVNAVCSQNSGIRSDATCSQQDDNCIPLCGVNELSDKGNVLIEPQSSSAYSATENSISNTYEELEADTKCTSESEGCPRSVEKNNVTQINSKMTAIQLRSKESRLCGNMEAILLDENAVSSLSPSYTFYGTVDGMSDMAMSQDNINDSDVLHGTHISSADSPASPVLGSASKLQKGARARRCENDGRIKVKCIERCHNSAVCDTALCSLQRNVTLGCNMEAGETGEHCANGEAYNQSLPTYRRNFKEIGVLSLERQRMLNVFEGSHLECEKGGSIGENALQNFKIGVSDGFVVGATVKKSDEACGHQNEVSFGAEPKNLIQSKSCSDTSLLSKTCFRDLTSLHGTEKFNSFDICSSTVPGTNYLGSVENLHQEEQSFLPSTGDIKTNIQSADSSVSVTNVCSNMSDTGRSMVNSDIKSLLGEHQKQLCFESDDVETQETSSNRISENISNSHVPLKELYDKAQPSKVKDVCNEFKVPGKEHNQLSSHSLKNKESQNLLAGILCPQSDAVHDRDPSEKCNEPYTQDTEESCTQSDTVFEDFCFDSVKEFDSEYFDQFLDSPIIDTSKVTDRSRYHLVCDNSLLQPKIDHVRNDTCMDVGVDVSCGDSALQEPKFLLPEDSLNDSVAIERTCISASQSENSPLLFDSDDESSNSQWESTQTTLKENKSPLRAFTPVTMHSTIIEALHKKLQKIQELLLGIPPPPSITMPNHTVEDMLRLIKQNEHLMVQKSFPNCGNVPESSSLQRKSAALRDVLNTSWPQVKDCDFFDIQYNHGAVSEELDRQYQRLQERFIGRETASSCNPWFTTWNASRSSVRYQRSLGQSPGSRLSHLARRRQSFSSCNLQPASISGKLPGTMHRSAIERRVIMVDAKKEDKQQKNKINNRRLQRNTICIGEDDSRLRSSRRALFQSPVDDKKVSSYLKPRTESHNMKTDAWGGTTKHAENRSRSVNENFNINGKRVMTDSQSHPRKISRRLVFDASQPVGHSLPHNTEFSRPSSVSSQLMGKKSNSSYVNGTHRSQVHMQPLSSSQAASKSRISGTYKKKLLWAVAEALRRKGITMNHHLFHPCASSLTRLLLRVVGNTLLVQSREDSCKITSEQLLETALQHVHSVVQKTEAVRS